MILRTSPLWRLDFFPKWCSNYLSVTIVPLWFLGGSVVNPIINHPINQYLTDAVESSRWALAMASETQHAVEAKALQSGTDVLTWSKPINFRQIEEKHVHRVRFCKCLPYFVFQYLFDVFFANMSFKFPEFLAMSMFQCYPLKHEQTCEILTPRLGYLHLLHGRHLVPAVAGNDGRLNHQRSEGCGPSAACREAA